MTDAARRAAALRLGSVLRELNAATVVSEVRTEELDAVAAEAQALAYRLRVRGRTGPRASLDDPSRSDRLFNPVTGEGNPFALGMRLDPPQAGSFATLGRVTLGPGFEGHVGVAHGGVVALLLDEVCGTTAMRRVWPIVTGQLSVAYRRPVRIGVPLIVRADVERVHGNRMIVRGCVCAQAAPGTLLAEGEADFVELSRTQADRMLGSSRPRDAGS